jgi:hypothetical protein
VKKSAKVQIIVPKSDDDDLSEALRRLTREIVKADPEIEGGGFLGGPDGYGCNIETEVFTRRFYWGECDCDDEERSEKWHKAHPHDPRCFRDELHRRFAKYDEESGYNSINAAAFRDGDDFLAGHTAETEATPFGTVVVSTPRQDDDMKKWRAAHSARDKAHTKLTRELYVERKLPISQYQWLCTCGVDEMAKTADLGHRPTCAVMLPNFLYKPTGLEVRWYKWIGRDNEVNGDPGDLTEMIEHCVSSLAPKN